MCAYDAGEKSKAEDPLTVVMFEALIVDEGDIPVDDGLEHLPVTRLLLFGVREEEIGLAGDEVFCGYLFYPEEDVAAADVFLHVDSCVAVFPVGITAVG
jgi:hypothetical protein